MKIPNGIVTFFFLLITAVNALPAHADSPDLDISFELDVSIPLYIDNLNIIDMTTGEVIENRQLQIRDGKVVAINRAGAAISDERHILHDGRGGYVMPGLIDMHVHAYDPAAFVITLAHGVTHLRLMNGVAEHLTWRKELAEGSRIGSTITVSSPIVSGFRNAYMHYEAHTPAQARKAVAEANKHGYDLIKAYGNLTAPVLRALLREARKHNIPVAKHGPHPAGEMAWNELTGLQTLEHVEDIFQGPLDYREDQQKLDDTIANLKALNTPVTPTLNVFWQLTEVSERKQSYLDELPKGYISPIVALEASHGEVKRWLNSAEEMVAHNKKTLIFLQKITRQLYRSGIPLLVGSDSGVLLSPHGLATHKEMALMQEAGLPNISVLRAVTINPARALGKESKLGLVAVGYRADLVLTEQNPLENLTALHYPEAVVKSGRFFSKSELEQLRSKAIDERSFWDEMNTLRKAW